MRGQTGVKNGPKMASKMVENGLKNGLKNGQKLTQNSCRVDAGKVLGKVSTRHGGKVDRGGGTTCAEPMSCASIQSIMPASPHDMNPRAPFAQKKRSASDTNIFATAKIFGSWFAK